MLNFLSCTDNIPRYNFPEKTIYTIEEVTKDCSSGEMDDTKSLFNFLESSALELLSTPDEKLEKEMSQILYSHFKDSIVENQNKSKILSILEKMKPYTKEKSFSVYIINSKTINAMVGPGGKVFITTGILNFFKNDEELAIVLGHELGHIENGHIEKKIKRKSIANELGEFGLITNNLLSVFLAPFGSVEEYVSDRTGLYLAYKAGYDPMKGIEVIKRMSSFDEEKNSINDFFKTHPYSIDRYYCSKTYLESILVK
jgi:predicted Zn-dependent protease